MEVWRHGGGGPRQNTIAGSVASSKPFSLPTSWSCLQGTALTRAGGLVVCCQSSRQRCESETPRLQSVWSGCVGRCWDASGVGLRVAVVQGCTPDSGALASCALSTCTHGSPTSLVCFSVTFSISHPSQGPSACGHWTSRHCHLGYYCGSRARGIRRSLSSVLLMGGMAVIHAKRGQIPIWAALEGASLGAGEGRQVSYLPGTGLAGSGPDPQAPISSCSTSWIRWSPASSGAL